MKAPIVDIGRWKTNPYLATRSTEQSADRLAEFGQLAWVKSTVPSYGQM